MLKLFQIQIDDAFYAKAFSHFVLAEDMAEAWALLTGQDPGETWLLERAEGGQYQTRQGKVVRPVTISEIPLDRPRVLR